MQLLSSYRAFNYLQAIQVTLTSLKEEERERWGEGGEREKKTLSRGEISRRMRIISKYLRPEEKAFGYARAQKGRRAIKAA